MPREKKPPAPATTTDPETQLDSFLAKYLPEIESAAREARARLRQLTPGAIELVYDNYNALVIGYGPTDRASDAILSLVLNPKWLTVFFLQGLGLHDPQRILEGSGNLARHVRLKTPDDLDAPAMSAMIAQSLRKARVPLDPAQPHRLVIKSISAKQRPRQPGRDLG